MDKIYDYIIVGNGILGIHLARIFESKKLNYIILEKSRNVGGRFSSRRFDDLNFDFGVRNFYWNKDFFNDEIEIGLKDGDLYLNNGKIYAKDTFNVWTKKLAKGLNVQQLHVDSCSRIDSEFIEVKSQSDVLLCRKLILTCPAAQSYDLLNDERYNALKNVSYSRDIFYMCQTDRSEIIDNELELLNSKFVNDRYYHIFKVKNWSEKTREELKSYFDLRNDIKTSFAHKWRYSKVINTIEYFSIDSDIFILGDYFSGGLKGSYDSCGKVLKKI